MSNDQELQRSWRQPPPGTEIVTTGVALEGDLFYIEQFGAWAPVPKKYVGTQIGDRLVVRGKVDWNQVTAWEEPT